MEQRSAALHSGSREAAAEPEFRFESIAWDLCSRCFLQIAKLPTSIPPRPRDTNRFNAFFHAMLDQGIYLPPSQFEAAFISAAHTESDIDHTIEAATTSFFDAKPMSPATAPYGSWASPITSSLLTSAGIGFSELSFRTGRSYWLESRRTKPAVWCWFVDIQGGTDVTPQGVSTFERGP